MPLCDNGELDLDNFSLDQMEAFYWDNPEALPDRFY